MTATRIDPGIHSAITAGNQRLLDRLAKRDFGGMAECYTTDGQVLPAGHDAVTGKDAIAEFWRGAAGLGITRADLTTVEVMPGGEIACEVGRYRLFAGDQQADHGKYIVIWKEEGGEWKLHRDMFTSSVPQAS
jgi:ketosteroid isomerase-like protein